MLAMTIGTAAGSADDAGSDAGAEWIVTAAPRV